MEKATGSSLLVARFVVAVVQALDGEPLRHDAALDGHDRDFVGGNERLDAVRARAVVEPQVAHDESVHEAERGAFKMEDKVLGEECRGHTGEQRGGEALGAEEERGEQDDERQRQPQKRFQKERQQLFHHFHIVLSDFAIVPVGSP